MADAKTTTAPAVATPEEVADRRAESEAEYGTYVAVAAISFNGAAAYNPGDPVPVTNVKRYKYDEQGLVQKVGTKTAQDAIRAAVAEPAPTSEIAPQVSLGVPLKD